jgi:hypothetical protein
MSTVSVERESVDHQGVAEEVEVLAGVADAVRAADPESVFDVAVDRFRVVASRVETREVRIRRWDGPYVLGAIELACDVFCVAVESDGDGLVLERLHQTWGFEGHAVGNEAQLELAPPGRLAVRAASACGASTVGRDDAAKQRGNEDPFLST